MDHLKVLMTMSLLSLLSACRSSHAPLTTASQVDLPKFMGDWYVIANIPTSIERGAHNAVERTKVQNCFVLVDRHDDAFAFRRPAVRVDASKFRR